MNKDAFSSTSLRILDKYLEFILIICIDATINHET